MKEAHFHRRHLPHIYLDEAIYFITFRLKGSIPFHQLNELQSIIRFKNSFLTKEMKCDLNEFFFTKYDELLDRNQSELSLLQQANLADIVKSALHFYDSEDYILYSYCIMPNHVHILFEQMENARSISKIMQSVKRFTARENHIVRDDKDFYRILHYIINNPVKAKLVEEWDEWPHTYVAQSIAEL
jgi:REP element-mobilizing transposase RayT